MISDKNILKKIMNVDLPEQTYIQVVRFGIIGTFTMLIDMGLLVLWVEVAHIAVLYATAGSFLVASCLNYLLSVKWVFYRGRFEKLWTEFSMFIIFTLMGLGLNQLIMYLGAQCSTKYVLIKIVSIIIVTIFNYLTKKMIVFVK
jgi:putative flippase GtrA